MILAFRPFRPQREGLLWNRHDGSRRASLHLADISQLGHDPRVGVCLLDGIRQGRVQMLLEVVEFLWVDQKGEDRGFFGVSRVDHDTMRDGNLVEIEVCRLLDNAGDLLSRRSIPSASDQKKPLEIRTVQHFANVLQIAMLGEVIDFAVCNGAWDVADLDSARLAAF